MIFHRYFMVFSRFSQVCSFKTANELGSELGSSFSLGLEREREQRFKQKFARATFLRQLRTAYGNEVPESRCEADAKQMRSSSFWQVRGLRRDVNPDGHTATLTDIRRYCRQVRPARRPQLEPLRS